MSIHFVPRTGQISCSERLPSPPTTRLLDVMSSNSAQPVDVLYACRALKHQVKSNRTYIPPTQRPGNILRTGQIFSSQQQQQLPSRPAHKHTCRLLDVMSRRSAGTLSPDLISTMSPGTSSSEGMVCRCPSRSTCTVQRSANEAVISILEAGSHCQCNTHLPESSC